MDVWIYAPVSGGEVPVLKKQPAEIEEQNLVVHSAHEPGAPGIKEGGQYRMRLSPNGRIFPVGCQAVEGTNFYFVIEVDVHEIPPVLKPPQAPEEVKFISLETPEMEKQILFARLHAEQEDGDSSGAGGSSSKPDPITTQPGGGGIIHFQAPDPSTHEKDEEEVDV